PRVIHAVDDFRWVALLCEKRLHRDHDGGAEREEIAGADVAERVAFIGLVLFRTVMSEADLVLIIEPGLIVLRPRGVEHPLAEALPNRLGVFGIDLVRLRIFVVSAEMRMIEDDAAPGLEQVV